MDTVLILSAKYLFVVSVLVIGVFFVTRRWPAQKDMALFAIPAGILTYVLGFLGSLLYNDPRPFVVGHFTPLIAHAADNGFPSDHTLFLASLASVGMYWNKWLGAALWIITLLVATSRVYLGLHHPIDVLGSIVFALIATAAWHVVGVRVRSKR